jgi:hypothetical protein
LEALIMYRKDFSTRMRMLAGLSGLLLATACSGNTTLTGPRSPEPPVRPSFAARACKSPRIVGGPVQIPHVSAAASVPAACAAGAASVLLGQ